VQDDVLRRLDAVGFERPLPPRPDALNLGVLEFEPVEEAAELELALILLELIERPYSLRWDPVQFGSECVELPLRVVKRSPAGSMLPVGVGSIEVGLGVGKNLPKAFDVLAIRKMLEHKVVGHDTDNPKDPEQRWQHECATDEHTQSDRPGDWVR